MNARGFTLFELLISLTVITLLLLIAVPSLSEKIKTLHIINAQQTLMHNIEFAREKAVIANTRVTVRNFGVWSDGWEIFIDSNNNGTRDYNENLLYAQEPIKDVTFLPNSKVATYISFIGTGESKLVISDHSGFQAGTINICTTSKNKGFSLVLSASGRVRTAPIGTAKCSNG